MPLSQPADREWTLLLHIARPLLDAAQRAQLAEMVAAGVDWARLVPLAQQHGLQPLLARHLTARGAPPLPDELGAALRQAGQANAQRNLRLTAETLAVVDLLRDAGTAAMPYKGPLLSLLAYGDLALRSCADIDILIHPEDLDAAAGALERAGYRSGAAADAGRLTLLLGSTHEISFHAPGRTPLEVHWRIAQRAFVPRLDHAELWRGAREVSLQGRTVRTLGAEDVVIAACVHGAKHAWRRLEWLASLAALAARPEVDWGLLRERASRWGVLRLVWLGVLLAHDLLGAAVPPGVLEEARRDGAMTGAARGIEALLRGERHPTAARVFLLHLQARDRPADRLRFVRDCAFLLSPEDLAAASLPRRLHAGYYVIRPLRLLRNLLRRAPTG